MLLGSELPLHWIKRARSTRKKREKQIHFKYHFQTSCSSSCFFFLGLVPSFAFALDFFFGFCKRNAKSKFLCQVILRSFK